VERIGDRSLLCPGFLSLKGGRERSVYKYVMSVCLVSCVCTTAYRLNITRILFAVPLFPLPLNYMLSTLLKSFSPPPSSLVVCPPPPPPHHLPSPLYLNWEYILIRESQSVPQRSSGYCVCGPNLDIFTPTGGQKHTQLSPAFLFFPSFFCFPPFLFLPPFFRKQPKRWTSLIHSQYGSAYQYR
jgi:hypothetical protein